MPWVPRTQSSGCEAWVKFVRRVIEFERVESSERETGGKRWSSNALYVHTESQLECVYCQLISRSIVGEGDSRSQSISPQSSTQLLRFKRANAPPKTLITTSG